MSLNHSLIRILGGLLSPSGHRAKLSILMFHNVTEDPDPLRDSIDAAWFNSIMGFLSESFNVLPLSEAVQMLAAQKLPARSVCITFDDGYADNHRVAMPILKQWDLPAIFFISTGFLDGGRMWNDTVIEAIKKMPGYSLDLTKFNLGVMPIQNWEQRNLVVNKLLSTLKHLPLLERENSINQFLSDSGVNVNVQPMMSKTQVREIHSAGMEIGGHTINHPILNAVSEKDAWEEIVGGKQELEKIVGGSVDVFAYPNGKPDEDYSYEHVKILKAAGFKAAVNTSWGAATASTDCFQLPRFTPWDKDHLKFGIRLLLNCRRNGEVVNQTDMQE